MEASAKTLILLGVLLLLGLLTDAIGRRVHVPRVTLLLLLGFAIGPTGLALVSPSEGEWYPIISYMALVMVGFLLGEEFTIRSLKKIGRVVLLTSLCEVIVTALIVFLGLSLMGAGTSLAVLLGAVATATAPAATSDVVHEYKARGTYSRILLGIVAVDDAWGLMVFSVALSVVHILTGQGASTTMILRGAWDIGGAFLVGIALGIPMAFITGRLRPGEPTLVEALGLVFLCGGVALWLHVSYILSAMIMGSVVANLARHHVRPFHAIAGIERPFMILFFLLAGASLDPKSLTGIGLLGSLYIILRIMGRLIGGFTGGYLSGSDRLFTRWIGLALMPQAGVAIGMMLVATQEYPELADTLVPVVIASTVFFEITGPVLTHRALHHWKESR